MADHAHAVAHAHQHADHADAVKCCSHHEVEIERHIVWYLIGGMLVLITTLFNLFSTTNTEIAQLPAMLGAIVLGAPLVVAAWREISVMKPSSSSLAALAILAAFFNSNYDVAGWLAFILLIAGQIVRRTASGAQTAIENLIHLTPNRARIVENGQERDATLTEVTVGQTVRVRPGENLPVDGKVVAGRSTINQASLTGEATPAEVATGDPVYAGTTNLTGGLDVVVTQVGEETTIGKVRRLILAAEQARSPRQLLIEQVAAFFVPVVLSVALIVWFMMLQNQATAARAADTAISVLIVTCPSALLLSSPTAMVAAFAAAARLGILVKQANYLEDAGNVDTVVFDKTGTITTGRFEVSRLAPAPGVDGADLLSAAANGEQNSNHPLAQSILTTARAARIPLDGSTDYEEIHGRGVKARTSQGEIHVGRASWLRELNSAAVHAMQAVEESIEGMTGVHVMRNGQYLGAVGLEDKVRPNTRAVIQRLRDIGVRQVAIFTGDRLSVAKRVGTAIGVDAIEAECLPEEKHDLIVGYSKQGFRTLMVGDGINDGPSLAAADVGVAMGLGGSELATTSAGVALMNDDLNRVALLMELSRRTRTIIAQNIAASIVIALIGLALAATGTLSSVGKAGLLFAAFYHFAGDVFVIANSFRLFRFGEDVAAAEESEQPMRRRQASVRGLAAQPA